MVPVQAAEEDAAREDELRVEEEGETLEEFVDEDVAAEDAARDDAASEEAAMDEFASEDVETEDVATDDVVTEDEDVLDEERCGSCTVADEDEMLEELASAESPEELESLLVSLDVAVPVEVTAAVQPRNARVAKARMQFFMVTQI